MAEDDSASPPPMEQPVALDAERARRTPRRVWALVLVAHLGLLGYLLLVRSFLVEAPDDLPELLRQTATWDSAHYIAIARHGYSAFNLAVLFPAYPLATYLVSFLLRDLYLSAYVVSFVAHALGAALLYRLTRLDQSTAVAWRTVVFSLIFPTAFVAVVPYSESLFLCTALGAFYFFRSRRYALAGAMAFVAASTRLPGLALTPALLAELFLNKREGRMSVGAWLAALTPCLGVLIFLGINWYFYGGPFYFMAVQRFHFGRQVAWPHVGAVGAWYSLDRAMPECLTVGVNELLGAALAWAVTVYAFFRLRASYALYCGLSAALFTFQSFWLCNLRYAYVLFPLYILMARVSRRSWAYYAMTATSLVWLAILAMQFARGYWAS